jgi:metal transporter CNNM
MRAASDASTAPAGSARTISGGLLAYPLRRSPRSIPGHGGVLVWIGIAFCLSQSATLSGLNLAVFSLSRLRLEAAAEVGDPRARRVLELRRDANFTLVTILIGNVAINVLLTLLADSVMVGVAAFVFSTLGITMVGEILPQAYFTRHALSTASRLTPVLRVYQILLWPVARPVGHLLDRLVGPEGISWLREHELRTMLERQARHRTTEIGGVEALGAINFLALDDLPISLEGQALDPASIITFPLHDGGPAFPSFERSQDDPLLQALHRSGRKWVIVTDPAGEPRFVINAHEFLRRALFDDDALDPLAAVHRPLIVRDPDVPLGEVLANLTVRPEHPGDDVVDEDLIVVWTDGVRRVITGSDILGRLLRGIVRTGSGPPPT